MNNNSMVLSPASIGSAVAGTAGSGLWRLIKLMFRQPLASAGIIVLGTGGVMATTNALFYQPVRHPAPLFIHERVVPAPAQQRIAPEDIPNTLDRTSSLEQTAPPALIEPQVQQSAQQSTNAANITPVPLPAETGNALANGENVGNADVAALQEKLTEMRLFDGDVDGYYGPQTAAAIRAFEMRQGLNPQGALTPEIMQLVQNARIDTPRNAPVEPAPMVRPQGSLEDTAAPVNDPIGELALAAANETSGAAQLQQASYQQPAAPEPVAQPSASATSTAPQREVLNDPALIQRVQEGLVRLGFLHSEIDGVFDQNTARAVREFENYYNYEVTGKMAPQLVRMLQAANAFE